MLDFRVIRRLLEQYGHALDVPVRDFVVGHQSFHFGANRYLTGVINLSPDSWYAESVCHTTEAAVLRAKQLREDGAHLIDIGAESSLPSAERVEVPQQLDRLLPVVRRLVAMGMLVSVESYHPEVLDACGTEGAHVFNVTGMADADVIFEIAAAHHAAVILCHVQGENVREVSALQNIGDVIPQLLTYFSKLIVRMEQKGVDRAFIDPGLGFYYQNLTDGEERVRYQIDTFLQTFRLAELGYPTFNIVPHAPNIFIDDERREAESFFSVLAWLGGTHMVRTHEVRRLSRVLKAMGLYPSEEQTRED
ncbi:MAG: dihydropteroate synthase [Myxococcales bacterium]|nr:dihydropteroate synthase [Myxococcales bacterium]